VNEKALDITIVVVSYNTLQLLRNTLRTVYQSRGNFQYEVIIVDNASQDGSPDMVEREFPQAKLIRNQENVGFSAANNQAIRMARGKYVLLLNSDTEIQPDTLQIMLNFMESNMDVGASGCRVIRPDGKLDLACKRSFPTPLNSLYRLLMLDKIFPHSPRFGAYNLTYLNEYETHEVDCLVGAFMMVRKDTIDQVGLLDERFFMYGEDIDWCYRIKKAGWRIVYFPKTTILHMKRASSYQKPKPIIYAFHHAMWLYYEKHHKDQYPWIITQLVKAGIWGRYILEMIRNAWKKRRV
jgi:GT2 family glycosyltransferase